MVLKAFFVFAFPENTFARENEKAEHLDSICVSIGAVFHQICQVFGTIGPCHACEAAERMMLPLQSVLEGSHPFHLRMRAKFKLPAQKKKFVAQIEGWNRCHEFAWKYNPPNDIPPN